MPRRRKDQQAPAAAPGQAYGENQAQVQAQNVIPLPNVVQPGEQATPPAGPTAAGAPEGAGGNPLEALLAAATGTPAPQGDLFGPSSRPSEPVTAGLPMGAGPGREAVAPPRARMRTVRDTFRMLADVTGNPMYRRLADEAEARGA